MLRAALLGAGERLEDQRDRALADDEAVAALVPRTARGGRVVALRQRHHRGESADAERA